jgi:hypothetical protein
MARKTLQTPDRRHVQLGEQDTVTMPEGFTAPDDGATCSGWFGRILENPADAGFGSAYIDRDDYED